LEENAVAELKEDAIEDCDAKAEADELAVVEASRVTDSEAVIESELSAVALAVAL
jgi:hypothetical protein